MTSFLDNHLPINVGPIGDTNLMGVTHSPTTHWIVGVSQTSFDANWSVTLCDANVSGQVAVVAGPCYKEDNNYLRVNKIVIHNWTNLLKLNWKIWWRCDYFNIDPKLFCIFKCIFNCVISYTLLTKLWHFTLRTLRLLHIKIQCPPLNWITLGKT